jgi:type II secretory pathway pseudopilin PulG
MTLIEVAVAIAVVGGVLLASASAFSGSLRATANAARITQSAIFLEGALENVSAQNYDNLLAFDDNVIFDGTGADDSDFSVGLTVFLSEVDLIQIQATLTDLRSGRVIGRATTLRSRR